MHPLIMHNATVKTIIFVINLSYPVIGPNFKSKNILDINSFIMHKLINYACSWSTINLVIFEIRMSYPINGPNFMSNEHPL